MPKRLPHVDAARNEALKYGASFDTENRSKHICGHIRLNGKCRKVFLSVSPSDNSSVITFVRTLGKR